MNIKQWRKLLNFLDESFIEEWKDKNWYVEAWNKKTKEKVEGKVVDIYLKNKTKVYKLDNGKTINEKEWSINTMG